MIRSIKQSCAVNPISGIISNIKPWRVLGAALVAATVLLPQKAKADDPKSLETLRAESLKSPTEYDKSLAYVRAAITARDYEAAIVVLERLLFYSPNMPGIKFELGNLYAGLGAHAMAVHYYESALASRNLDEVTRIKAQAFLTLSRKELLQDKFSGSVQLGYQYRSNPASLPNGFDPFFPDLIKYQNGGRSSLYALGQISYRHDFETGRGDQFEAEAQGYTSRQFEYSELNYTALSMKAGPRISLVPDANGGITLRPYLVGDQSWLDGNSFFSTFGVGTSLWHPSNPWSKIEPGIEWRKVNTHFEFPEISSSTLFSGTLTKAYIDLKWLALNGVTVFGNVFLSQNNADPVTPFLDEIDLSSKTMGASISVKFDVTPPMKTIPFNWSIVPFFSITDVKFDNENSSLFINEKRHDRMTRIGIQFLAPITEQWGFFANMDFRRNRSNVDDDFFYNFNNDSRSVMIGATTNF